jgi:dipeptidyl aminopeptidase/acylaminoacyl peptidase
LNGAGYFEQDRNNHIWVVGVPQTPGAAQKTKQITSGEFSEGDITWSRDGSKIYFTSNRVKDSDFEPPDSDLYQISAGGGAITKIASIDGPIHSPALSPDGRKIAFIGDINRDGGPARSYSQPDLFVTSAEPGRTPKNLTANYDFDIGGGVGGDQAPPRGGGHSTPYWSTDGKTIIVTSAEQGRVNLKRVDAETGNVSALTDGNFDLFSYDPTRDGSRIVALISTPTDIGDLFLVDGKSGRSEQITHINEDLFAQLNLSEPEMIWYKSFDGRKIQAWVQRPPDSREGKKYPMILDIHGGPHSAYGYTFDHEFQWMAAKGYVVLYPNPRGSTSYGQEFGNVIQYHYPGDDFKDLMAGVDDLIARGWADPDRLGGHRRQRRRSIDELDGRPHQPVQGGRFAKVHRGLGRLVVWRRHDRAVLVPGRALGVRGRFQGTLADHLCDSDQHAADAHRRGIRLSNAARIRRRTDVPGAEIPA